MQTKSKNREKPSFQWSSFNTEQQHKFRTKAYLLMELESRPKPSRPRRDPWLWATSRDETWRCRDRDETRDFWNQILTKCHEFNSKF